MGIEERQQLQIAAAKSFKIYLLLVTAARGLPKENP
jgi:hypothetical protein